MFGDRKRKIPKTVFNHILLLLNENCLTFEEHYRIIEWIRKPRHETKDKKAYEFLTFVFEPHNNFNELIEVDSKKMISESNPSNASIVSLTLSVLFLSMAVLFSVLAQIYT